jgi:thioredoxin reductase
MAHPLHALPSSRHQTEAVRAERHALLHLGAATHDHRIGRFVRTDEHGRTTIPSIWAVGNVADPRAQLITAAGDAARAAISIDADLTTDDVATSVASP